MARPGGTATRRNGRRFSRGGEGLAALLTRSDRNRLKPGPRSLPGTSRLLGGRTVTVSSRRSRIDGTGRRSGASIVMFVEEFLRRKSVGVLFAVGSGALFSLSFPPAALSILGWIALVPFYLVVVRTSPLHAFTLGMAWCGAAGFGVAHFFAGTVSEFFSASTAVGWAAFAGVILVIAPVLGAYAYWLAWLSERDRASSWHAAAGWGVCEAARSQLGGIGSWSLLAYSQVPNTPVVQVLDVVGPYGLGMSMAACSFTLARILSGKIPIRSMALETAAVAAIIAAILGYGHWRLGQSFGSGTRFTVALVQSGVEREGRSDPSGRSATLLHQIDLTESVIDQQPNIIFWPEYAVDFYLREDSPERRLLLERSSQWGADLILGGPHYRSRHEPPDYHNSAFLIRDGRFGGRYDKIELLPFAESNPLQRILPRDVHYKAGGPPEPLQARVTIGIVLCSEVLNPRLTRAASRNGAEILANPASDDWFHDPAPSRMLIQAAAARAIENRRYLVRITQTGHSAIIDPHGKIIAIGPSKGEAVVFGEVEASDSATLYNRLGDVPVWLAMAFVPTATLYARRRETNT
jgi:apolipoprotein N-acyltransferase